MRDKVRAGRLTQAAAEEIAARALLFLAQDSGRLSRFLADTGIDPDRLRARLQASETLAAVLAHILADEPALLAFAANAGLRPEDVVIAESTLGGRTPRGSVS